MTTRSSPPASEQPAQRSRSKREQVLVACKVCRGRKTKCSGERPRCQQCETRDQVCEWEVISEEAPRAAKRKYQDLEQRSASEHELLNHLRALSAPSCLRLLTRLREGCPMDELLIFARELSNIPASEPTPAVIQHHDMTNRPHGTAVPREILDSEPHNTVDENRFSARPTLPPLASIWYPPEHPIDTAGSPPIPRPSLPSLARNERGKSAPQGQTRNSTSLYDRWMNQA